MQRLSIVRAICFWALALPCTVGAVVLDPPVLRCASVNAAGDVDLTWTVPPDPGGDFNNYTIWHSNSASGPYVVVASIMVYGTTGWTLFATAASSAPQYYHMTTVSTAPPPNESAPSDTLGTLFLTVNQSTPAGSALLDWTPQHSPPIGTAGPTYDIWMEYPIGSWSLVGQVGNTVLSYDHVISICEDSLTFRIGLVDDLGCVSFSNPIGDMFADATPPTSPGMVTVSVDTITGLATLDWDPSPEDDTDAYIIVWSSPGGNVIIDTIYGQFNTSYVWLASGAAFGAESFTIAAFDTCWTGTPPSPNTSATLPPHTTVYAGTQYDKCAAEIQVDWTPYGGWTVENYEVYAQKNGGVVYLLGTYPPAVHTCTHPGVDPFATYCYVVKALRDGGGASSLSNKTCRITDYPAVPTWNYLRTVTVAGPDQILVVDSVDMSAVVKRYRIQRSSNGDPFQHVATISGSAGPLIQWTDFDVETDARSYRYRVIVDDSCGTELITSNEGATIFLRAEPDLQGFNQLVWNGYEEWAGAVSGYLIMRSVGDDPFVAIAMNGPGEWSYTDDVRDLTATNGRFCYMVEAIEAGNPSGINATSLSDQACAIQDEQVWIPNAFIAGSAYNPEFIPVTAYTNFDRYELIVFNRWGQSIWSTTDPDQGWDGKVNGRYVPQGVYGYYCAFQNGEGREFTKRGTVAFLFAVE